MATLEQIAAALKAADAAGNVEDATRLAAAYRQAQAGQSGPPAGAKPGSREYADWAVQQAKAGKPLPQVSPTPPEYTGPAPHSDIGTKLFAGAGSFIEGVPVAGPTLIDWAKQGRAAVQGMTKDAVDKEFATAKEANPITSTAGNIAGGVAALAPIGATALGGTLLGTTGSLGARLGFGAGSGALLSGADTAARGGDLGEIATNAGIGAGLGLAFPALGAVANAVGGKMAQRAATNAAVKGAPAAADLKSVASGMFQQLDQNGVQVSGQRFGTMVTDLVQKFAKLRANPTLDPKAVAALKEVAAVAQDVQQSGGGITLSDLHTLRQIAQKSAQSAEGRDKMFSSQIISGIDDMIASLKPGDMIGGSDPKQAANLMFDAISTWGRSKRVGLLEEAIYKAQNTASGVENGLRTEFRKLLQNPDTRKLFTAAERQAIEDVVRGNVMSNTMKLLGKFGFGSGNASNMLGGSIGSAFGAAVGSPLGPFGSLAGAAVAGGGASLARKASEKITEGAASRAAKVVATPNVPVLPQRALPPGVLPPAVLPVELTKKRKPIEIVVRGGNPALAN